MSNPAFLRTALGEHLTAIGDLLILAGTLTFFVPLFVFPMHA